MLARLWRGQSSNLFVNDLKNLYPDLTQSPPMKSFDKASSMPEDLNASFEKLSMSVQYIKGVGPKVARLLGKKGIKTVEDMLYYLPRRYEDRRSIKKISSTQIGNVETVIGEVIHSETQRYRKKKKAAQRNHIEGKFGQGKRGYGLNDIKARLPETSESWINAIIFVMNLTKLIQVAEKYPGFFVQFLKWFEIRFKTIGKIFSKQLLQPRPVLLVNFA